MMSSERDNLLAVAVKEWIGAYQDGIRALPLRRGNCCIDFDHTAGCDDMQLPAKCPRRLLLAELLPPTAASTATCRRTRSFAPLPSGIRGQHCGRLHSPSHSIPDWMRWCRRSPPPAIYH